MEIEYQGTDITEFVQVRRCIVNDTVDGRCDSIELEFYNASAWYGWDPKEDDQIQVSHGEYHSGGMYLNMIRPQDDIYRIVATSLPSAARRKITRSFVEKTIEEIVRTCAADTGLGYQIFGMDAATVIPYIQQEEESSAAFLNKLFMWEGAAFKVINGMYSAIDIMYAQDIDPCQAVEINADDEAIYERDENTCSGVNVKTPYAEGLAKDLAVSAAKGILVVSPPARNNIQAARWARGKLLHISRKQEAITLETEFNQGITALARIDITGNTDASGEWLVETATHDLINLTTRAKMHRCIRTIQ